MSTRYYPTKRQNSSRFRGPSAGEWGAFGTFAPYEPDWHEMISTSKANGGQIAAFTCSTNQSNDYDYIIRRHVSEPLEAQNISGTFDLCFMTWARFYDNAVTSSTPVRFKVHVYISTGDDPTPRHVLLDNYVDSVDWPNFPFNQWMSLAAPQSLTAGDAEAGDRLVIEWGCRIVSAATPVVTYPPTAWTEFNVYNNGTTNSSNVAWPDAVAGDTSPNEVGWFDFSDTITEQAAPAAPANDSCDDAIEIVAFPYQSAPIVTISSADTDRGVWWKFTAPTTGLVIVTTLRTNYRCELLVYTGADCASKVAADSVEDIAYAAMSNSCAWINVTEGEQYFINLQMSHNSSIGAINSGGICEVAVNYFAEDLVNDDIYIPVSERIYVYRDGAIVKLRATGGETCTGAYFDYSQLPIISLNGDVEDTQIRFCFALFGFDLVEILDTDTLNWDENEVDFLDGWYVPGNDGLGVAQIFVTPEGQVYASQWGNGFLYVAGIRGGGANPTVYLNDTADDPVLMEIVSQTVDQGFNQPGYPFAFDAWQPAPEITTPWCIAFDQDAGILYYNSGGDYVPVGGQTIKRFDITNDNQLSDFITLAAGGGANDGLKGICQLSDGTFLVCNATEVKLLAANGTTIRTFTPSVSMDSQNLIDVRPTTDENFFWVIDQASTHMFKFNIASGLEVDDILVSAGPGNLAQFAIYGIVEPPPPSNPLSGIYKIVPNSRKSNDTLYTALDPETTEDVKIPDPYFKSGLIGE